MNTFGWNDWFSIILSVLTLSLYLPIRRYFQPIITIIIWLYSVAFVETIDYFLAGSPFKLYYFGDNDTYEPSTAIMYFTLKGYKLIVYILLWTAIAISYEWLCVINKVLTYTGWKLLYSVPTYPVASLIIILVYHFIKRKLKEPIPHLNRLRKNHR